MVAKLNDKVRDDLVEDTYRFGEWVGRVAECVEQRCHYFGVQWSWNCRNDYEKKIELGGEFHRRRAYFQGRSSVGLCGAQHEREVRSWFCDAEVQGQIRFRDQVLVLVQVRVRGWVQVRVKRRNRRNHVCVCEEKVGEQK